MKLKLIIIGILICILCLSLLIVMDLGDEPSESAYTQKTYFLGGEPMKTYVMESEQESLFDKWHREQRNVLAQKEWEAYMEDDDEE
jgi:hypothetical protein